MNESLPTFVRTHFLPLLLMLMLAFCVFGNTLGHDWTYDDFPVVVENPDVKSWSGFLENRYPGRPIREITYLVDHTLFGSNPSGYHGQSILWHCLAGFLIYRVMVALGLGGVAGLLSGILFIVHPITVEAVANVSHRKESLSLVFSLLALLTYQRAFKTSSLSWLFVLGSFGFAAIAFMSKQTAVCLPFAFLAYEWVFVDRERWKLLRCWKALIGLTSVGVAGGLFWMWTNGGVDRYIVGFQGLLQSKSNYFGPAQFDVYFQTLLKSWAFSFSKLLLPVELSAEYIIVPPQGWLTPLGAFRADAGDRYIGCSALGGISSVTLILLAHPGWLFLSPCFQCLAFGLPCSRPLFIRAMGCCLNGFRLVNLQVLPSACYGVLSGDWDSHCPDTFDLAAEPGLGFSRCFMDTCS